MKQHPNRWLSIGLAVSLLHGSFPSLLSAKSSLGEISKIDLTDTAKITLVTIHGQDVGKCQPVVLREPSGSRPPKIVLPFSKTTVRSELQGTRVGSGSIDSIDVSQLSEGSNPLAQIVISLTGETPYRIKKTSDGLSIEVDHLPESISANPPTPTKLPSSGAIMPGDVLFVTVSPADELSRELTVDQNGKIYVPLVGALEVSGMTPDSLARKLTGMLAQYVTNPRVDVLIKQFSAQQVSITGQVRNPGSFPFRQNLRLLDVVSMAGGFTSTADKSQVRIYRGSGSSRRVSIFNASESLKSGDITRDYVLQAGDLVDVPKGVNPLTIFGDVVQSGNFDYYRDIRLLDLIALSHGFKDSANFKKITVFRGEPPDQKVILVRFSNVMDGHMKANIPLEPGDVVYVPTRALWEYSAVANTILPLTTLALTAATVYLAAKK